MRKLAFIALLLASPAFAEDPAPAPKPPVDQPKPAAAPVPVPVQAPKPIAIDEKLKQVLGDYALRNALLEVTNQNLNDQLNSLNAQLRDARSELEAAKKEAKPPQ